jgi:hypothetical protein
MTFLRSLVALSLVASLAACAHSMQAGGWGKAEPSGFLGDYSKLRPAKGEEEATLVYWIEDKAKFRAYKKVLLEQVQVWRGEKSDAKDLDKEDAEYLSQSLWSHLDEELRKDYTMVSQAGPGVIRLQVAITEAGRGVPFIDNVTALHPGARVMSEVKKQAFGTESFVGKASVEAKATDSQTGELLGAMVDRRGGGKYFWKSFHRWTDVEAAYSYWAKKTRWRACTMRGDANCELPKE